MGALVQLLLVAGAIAALGAVVLRLRPGARSRGSALGPFLRHFESEGVPPDVAATAFRQLQAWMDAQDRAFPVEPGQDLASVYGLLPEEVDAALERMARECGRRRDPARAARAIRSVADLVTELSRWPAA